MVITRTLIGRIHELAPGSSGGVHRHLRAPHQRERLEEVFSTDDVGWRVPFSHHPA